MNTKHSAAIEWLLAEGGPVIRYRTARELRPNSSAKDLASLRRQLADSPQVQYWLGLDSGPRPIGGCRYGMHGSLDCMFENLFAMLLQLGLDRSSPEFRTRAKPWRPVLAKAAAQLTPDFTGIWNWMAQLQIAQTFCWAGYRPQNVLSVIDQRIQQMQTFVEWNNDYTLMRAWAEESAALDKKHGIHARRWEVPPRYIVPNCLALWSMAAILPHYQQAKQTSRLQLVDAVIDRVLSEEFQRTIRDLGGAWRPYLPHYFPKEKDRRPRRPPSFGLLQTYLMSHFPTARKHRWFAERMEYLESFRTARGTYLLPSELLTERKGSYWCIGSHMSLGEDRKRRVWRELESTFWVLKIRASGA
jgi:hypothetical protein